MGYVRKIFLMVVALMGPALVASTVQSQDFYKDKTLNIIVGY